jgi:single-strand selective monofunctional uracil DNA glycosylase
MTGPVMIMDDIIDDLLDELRPLRFSSPITHVYNPLEYARAPYTDYLSLYGRCPKEVILLGMNPGPWGMAQTGVPFGEIRAVKEWLCIEAPVGTPSRLHPKRPVHGFKCSRSEVSGKRLWGWARETFGTPDRFFSRFFVANYCPLLFLEASGRNRTPDKLPAAERGILFTACDQALRRSVQLMEPRFVVGIGQFASERARQALSGIHLVIGTITHPSPANPKANRGWGTLVTQEVTRLGIQV